MSVNYKIQYYRYIVPSIVDSEENYTGNGHYDAVTSKQVSKKEWTMVCTADTLLAKLLVICVALL